MKIFRCIVVAFIFVLTGHSLNAEAADSRPAVPDGVAAEVMLEDFEAGFPFFYRGTEFDLAGWDAPGGRSGPTCTWRSVRTSLCSWRRTMSGSSTSMVR